MNLSLNFFQDWLSSKISPSCIVFSTERSKKIIEINNLSPSEFLRPFAHFTRSAVTCRFGTGKGKIFSSFKLDCFDSESFYSMHPKEVTDYCLEYLSNPKVFPKWHISDPIITKDKYDSLTANLDKLDFPWYKDFETLVFESLHFNPNEMYQQPLAYIIICSIDENPSIISDTLQNNTPPLLQQGILEVPRSTMLIILIDKREKMSNEQINKYKNNFMSVYEKRYYIAFWEMNDDYTNECVINHINTNCNCVAPNCINQCSPQSYKEIKKHNSRSWEKYLHKFERLVCRLESQKNNDFFGLYISDKNFVKFENDFHNFFETFACPKIAQEVDDLEECINQSKKGFKVLSGFFKKEEKLDKIVDFNVYKLTNFEKRLFLVGMYHFFFKNYENAFAHFKELADEVKQKSNDHYLVIYELKTLCQMASPSSLENKKNKEIIYEKVFVKYIKSNNFYKAIRYFLVFIRKNEQLNKYKETITDAVRWINFYKEKCLNPSKLKGDKNNLIYYLSPLLYQRMSIYYLLVFHQFRKYIFYTFWSGGLFLKLPNPMRPYSLYCFGSLGSFINAKNNSFLRTKESICKNSSEICLELKYFEGNFTFSRMVLELTDVNIYDNVSLNRIIEAENPEKFENFATGKFKSNYLNNYLISLKDLKKKKVDSLINSMQINSLNFPEINNSSIFICSENDYKIITISQNNLSFDSIPWFYFNKFSIIDPEHRFIHLDDDDLQILQELDDIKENKKAMSNYKSKRYFKGSLNEKLYIQIDIRNNLFADIVLNDIQLICEYSPPKDNNPNANNNNNNNNNGLNYMGPLELKLISEQFKTRETKTIELTVKSKSPGNIVIKGLQLYLFQIALIYHYFRTKNKNKLYSYTYRNKNLGEYNRRSSVCSESSSLSSHSNQSMHERQTSIFVPNSVLSKKKDLEYEILSPEEDLLINFPLGEEIECYQYELVLFPIKIKNNSKYKIERFTIYMNDSIRKVVRNVSDRNIIREYLTIVKQLEKDKENECTVLIPFIPFTTGNLYFKLLIKFEEVNKLIHIEVRRYLLTLKVKESLKFYIKENYEKSVIEKKKSQIEFNLESLINIENKEDFSDFKVNKIYYNNFLTLNNDSDTTQNTENNNNNLEDALRFETIDSIQNKKLYNKCKFKKILRTEKEKKNINISTSKDYTFPIISETIQKEQPHLTEALKALINSNEYFVYSWSAENKKLNKETTGLYVYKSSIQNPNITYQFFQNFLKNCVLFEAVPLSINRLNKTLIKMTMKIDLKNLKEVFGLSKVEVKMIRESSINKRLLGQFAYQVRLNQSKNYEELNFYLEIYNKGKIYLNDFKFSFCFEKKDSLNKKDENIMDLIYKTNPQYIII